MTEADLTEHTVEEKSVYRGKLLHVREDTVRLPDGTTARREYIVHPGAAMVIAMPDPRSVIMERQYRYPVRAHMYELPAGKLDPGEDALETARRELLEETGYRAAQWRHLVTTYPVVGYSDERIEIFLATGLEFVGSKLDDGEFLEVFTLSLDEAVEWIRQGRIGDSKTMTGLLLAQQVAAGAW
jgi:ADP-ribose pyrophosphatase